MKLAFNKSKHQRGFSNCWLAQKNQLELTDFALCCTIRALNATASLCVRHASFGWEFNNLTENKSKYWERAGLEFSNHLKRKREKGKIINKITIVLQLCWIIFYYFASIHWTINFKNISSWWLVNIVSLYIFLRQHLHLEISSSVFWKSDSDKRKVRYHSIVAQWRRRLEFN